MEDLFDKIFVNEGGVFKTKNSFFNKYLSYNNEFLDSLSSSGNFLKVPPDLYFNFINSPILNAKATLKENKGFIGFNAGGFFIIVDIFSKILSHSETFKYIGNTKIEKFNSPFTRNYYSDAHLLINFGDLEYNKYEEIVPVDDLRRAYSELLYKTALEFIFHHELVHILNGHISFIESHPEFKNHLTFQTLEMDADCIAISKVLGSHIRKFKGINEVYEPYKPFYGSFKSVIGFVYYSIITLFKIFSDNTVYKANNLTDLSHSKPRIRQYMAGATILEYFNHYFLELKDEFDLKILSDMTIEMEDNFKALTGLDIDTSDYSEAASDKAITQNREILEHWGKIRPLLGKYSFVDLVD